jgi:hypothetical protein
MALDSAVFDSNANDPGGFMRAASSDFPTRTIPRGSMTAVETEVGRPLRRARYRRKRQPWLRRIVIAFACIGTLAHFAAEPDQDPGIPQNEPSRDLPTTPEAALVAPPPRWEPFPEASPLFALRSVDGVLQPADNIRRHRSGARQDSLVFGSPGDEGHARLTLVRGLDDAPASFFVEMARLAGDAGLAITRSRQGFVVATKFGPFEAGGITVFGPAKQDCIAFRFAEASVNLRMSGWICGSEERPADDGHLICFIDHLALMPHADDAALRALFAQAESRQNPACAPAAPIARREDTVTAARKGS